MPKASTSLDSRQALRHNPLAEDYAGASLKQKTAKRKARKSDAADEKYVDSRASRKILQIGKELADEDQAENKSHTSLEPNPFDLSSRFPDDDTLEDPEQFDDDEEEAWENDEQEEEIGEEPEQKDLEIFDKFNEGRVKWVPFDFENEGPADEELVPEDAVEVPAKVVEAFSKVGLILSRYKSGKLPKIFKILPTLQGWQTLLSITRPDSWTPHAVYAATKIFVASKPAIVQEFMNEVLLPAVQTNIHENQKLNIHLYNALKKALYKPSAFFKGFLFPLLDGGCTQREAVIVASVITKVSVPVLHSAAALHRLCDIAAGQMTRDLDSAGAANICIRALLEKKYALPWQVVDSLVFHFLRFRATDPTSGNGEEAMAGLNGPGGRKAMADGKLPVVWHQGLLAFAQRYRDDITEDQREALLDLLLARGHPSIGPEIRRELLAGRGRGKVVEPVAGDGGDDTMVIDG